MLIILNKERQIIYANQLFLKTLNIDNFDAVIGKRPGEAVYCIHANQTEGGCRTTEFCKTCGAVHAILESQKGNQSIKECRIATTSGDALDLEVTTTPYQHEDESFTIFL